MSIKEEIKDYYTQKIEEHGATPQGVDWNSEDSQFLRFQQLSKVFEQDTASFSVLDFGCGFGSYLGYLEDKPFPVSAYTGFDIADKMLQEAQNLHGQKEQVQWINQQDQLKPHDYVIASGIFNIKQEQSNDDWKAFFHQTLTELNELAVKGIAFNVLTSYSDAEYMRDYLYYASPEETFAFCKTNFSKTVALLHNYPLYEFTILVNKDIL